MKELVFEEIKQAIRDECDGTYHDDPDSWDFVGDVGQCLRNIQQIIDWRIGNHLED
jgi:hypothetical protein